MVAVAVATPSGELCVPKGDSGAVKVGRPGREGSSKRSPGGGAKYAQVGNHTARNCKIFSKTAKSCKYSQETANTVLLARSFFMGGNAKKMKNETNFKITAKNLRKLRKAKKYKGKNKESKLPTGFEQNQRQG